MPIPNQGRRMTGKDAYPTKEEELQAGCLSHTKEEE
jgi:hypothetical protein